MRLILRFLKPHMRLCIFTLLFMVVDVVGALLIPSFAGEMLSLSSAAGATFQSVAAGGIRMAAVALLSGTGALIGAYCCSLLTSRVAADMRKALYKKSLEFSVSDFRLFDTASMTTREISDVTNIQFAILSAFQMLLPVPVIFIVSLTLSFLKNPTAGFILCGVLALISVIAWFIMRSAAPCFRKLQHLLDRMSCVLLENITGVRVIRAFNKEEHEKKRLNAAFSDYKVVSVKANLMFASLDSISFFTVNLFVLAIYWLSGFQIAEGALAAGEIVSLIEYALMALFYLMMAQMTILTLPRALECADRIDAVLKHTPQITDAAAKDLPLPKEKEVMTFENVSFHFPDSQEDALRGLSFVCRRGETTAIIGGTGSGKSTIASLMLRFQEVSEGKILLDGIDLRELRQDRLRDRISYVQQRAWLFSGTVAENLRFGKEDATDEDLWHALEIARADAFVRAQGGLNAFVAQGGTNFSGGQRQRLSIARAVVKKSELYLFDDSFSALDFKTDAEVRQALSAEIGDAAVVIVAQRVSSIRHADQILVLNEGQEVGIGTHEELMERCEVYREIYRSQTKEVL